MKIKSEIVNAYMKGKAIEEFKNSWFFQKEGYCYQAPSYEKDHIEAVGRIFTDISDIVENFEPCNLDIWAALFPEWRKIIGEVTVNLIVGFPEPNDATVIKAPDGINHVILDIGLWVKYEGQCDMKSVIHNLLTHELCHICIGACVEGIDMDIISNDYRTNLDANTFHEGFAHLVSFADSDISEVNWEQDKYKEIKEKNRAKMREALLSTEKQEQDKHLYDAVYGNYYDKFACMSGMFYIVQCWQKNGLSGIKAAFDMGYKGFSEIVV